MLNKLRKKLTLICVFITTAIMIIITLLALIFSEKQFSKRNQLALESDLANITQRLQYETIISHTWLRSFETSNHLIISISTEASPFLFSSKVQASSYRQELIALARQKALASYHFDALNAYSTNTAIPSVSFSLTYHSKHYLIAVAGIPTTSFNTLINSKTNRYELIVIKDLQKEDVQLFKLRLTFLILILLGILLLAFFSFWFVGKAIKPIQISHKEQMDFVSAASHELRSPLAVIEANADEMLSDDTITDKHYLHNITRETQHLSRLVNDLLLLARADSGRWSITLNPTEIDTLLLNIYDSYLPLAEGNHQSLELELPDNSILPIKADSGRLLQAISILIDNALTYTPPHKKIIIALHIFKSTLEIWVQDNGPGIPNSEKKHVFKRFYQVDSSRKSTQHYGLGLSIAYEIVKLHKGHLTLEDAPDGGCLFKIKLSYPPTSTP